MLEAKDQGHKAQVLSKKKKRSSQKFFRRSPKKKVFTKIFQAISTKKRFTKNFSSAPQNFNIPKNIAVLEPRTGQFSRTRGQGQGLDLRGQGLQNVFSRPRTSSRTPPLLKAIGLVFEDIFETLGTLRFRNSFTSFLSLVIKSLTCSLFPIKSAVRLFAFDCLRIWRHNSERSDLICETFGGFLAMAAFNNPALLISEILSGLLFL